MVRVLFLNNLITIKARLFAFAVTIATTTITVARSTFNILRDTQICRMHFTSSITFLTLSATVKTLGTINHTGILAIGAILLITAGVVIIFAGCIYVATVISTVVGTTAGTTTGATAVRGYSA